MLTSLSQIRWIAVFLVMLVAAMLSPVRSRAAASGAPELEPQVGLQARPASMAMSENRKWLAIVREGGVVDLWNLATGVLEHSTPMQATTAAFSRDGAVLAVSCSQSGPQGTNSVRLYNLARWRCIRTLAMERSPGNLCFSPDGRTLAVAAEEQVAFWDYRAGRRLRAITTHGEMTMGLALDFSPDADVLATAPQDSFNGKTIELWNVSSGTLYDTLETDAALHSFAFSPDSHTFAVGSGQWPDPTAVELWDIAAHKKTASFDMSGMNITGVSFTRDGKRVTACDETSAFHCWDIASGKLHSNGGGDGFDDYTAVSDDGRFAAVIDLMNDVRIFDTGSGKLVRRIAGNAVVPSFLAFSSDGSTLYQAGSLSIRKTDTRSAGHLIAWDTRTGQPGNQILTDTSSFTQVQSAANGALAVADSEGVVWIADSRSGTLRRLTTKDLKWTLGALAISPDGSVVAVASSREKTPLIGAYSGPPRETIGRLQLLRARDGRLLRSLPMQAWASDALRFSHDGKTLISETNVPGALDYWDVATGVKRRHIALQQNMPFPVTIGPDGTRAFVNGTLYDMQTGGKFAVTRNWYDVRAAAFSADSRLLAGFGDDGTVSVWNTVTHRRLHSWDMGPGMVRAMAFSPDGRSLAWLDLHGALKLWDVVRGRLRATLLPVGDTALPAGSVDWLAYTPDSYFTGSASADRYLRWRVNGSLMASPSLFAKFRRPDLVQTALSGRPQPHLAAALAARMSDATRRAERTGESLVARYEAEIRARSKPAPRNTPAQRLRDDLSTGTMYGDPVAIRHTSDRIIADLAAGARPDTRGSWGESALIFFGEVGNIEEVRKLLAQHVDVNLKNEEGTTALMAAAGEGYGEIVDLLLKSGADVQDFSGHSLLHPHATGAVLSSVLVKMFDPQEPRKPQIAENLSGMVSLLVKLGADPNVRDARGQTPVIFANSVLSEGGLLTTLLSAGADIDAQDKSGETALITACMSANAAIVKSLLEHGAKPDLRDMGGDTALMLVAGRDASDCVQLLLEHGADPNLAANEQDDHSTPLMMAAQGGYYASVKELIAHGANVNVVADGYSALGYAVQNRDAAAVRLLLSGGAAVTVRTAEGKTLLQASREADPSDSHGIAALLTAAGEKE